MTTNRKLFAIGAATLAFSITGPASTAMASAGESAPARAKLAKCHKLKQTVNFSVRALNGLSEVVYEILDSQDVVEKAIKATKQILAQAQVQGQPEEIARLQEQLAFFEREQHKLMRELKTQKQEWRQFKRTAEDEFERVYDKIKSGSHNCSEREELKIRRGLDRIFDELDAVDEVFEQAFPRPVRASAADILGL